MPGRPSATAATDPCAASEVARTVGSVATSMGNYLDSHPETNQALTTISQQQAGPQSLAALKTYFDANPQASKDLQALQTPLMDLSGALQAADHAAAGARAAAERAAAGRAACRGGLPGALPGAQTVGDARHCLPAQSRARRPSVATGTGPLPGPGHRHDEVAGPRPWHPRATLLNCAFRTFYKSFRRKARKSAPILLSFSVSVTVVVTGHIDLIR